MNKQDLYFDKDQHFWIQKDHDDFYFGITDYAQDQLGDILFVELPDLDNYQEEDYLLSIESDKKDQELFAPFDLEIIEVNEDLEDNPELINDDAFSNWIFKARFDEDNLDDLSSWTDYQHSI